jgi:hypothetical protein
MMSWQADLRMRPGNRKYHFDGVYQYMLEGPALMIENCRMNIEDLRSAFGESIITVINKMTERI